MTADIIVIRIDIEGSAATTISGQTLKTDIFKIISIITAVM